MLFLFPIIILSTILLAWTFLMSSIIVTIFPPFWDPLIWISLIGTLSFIFGIIGANVWPQPAASRLYFWGAISLWSITVAGFIAGFFLIISDLTQYSFQTTTWLITYIILAISANIWALYSSWVPRITSYKVKIHKEHNWHWKKIVMISDTHYGNIYGITSARSLVKRINTLDAEIVLIPWDFFDGPLIDYASIVKEFGNINAPHGVLFTNGNHEEYTHNAKILKSIKNPVLGIRKPKATEKLHHSLTTCKQEITVINNEKIEINGMVFAGVTYHDTETSAWLKKNLNELLFDDHKPNILLKHKPTLHSVLRKYPIDLVVSGHTHQAQMWPFTLVTYMIYGKYTYGIVKKNGMTSITSNGVWSWWPPHRIGTRSEIVVIEIV